MSVRPKVLVFLFLATIFLFFPKKVLAAFSLSISGVDPNSISYSEQEVTVSISINELPSESYFRVAWQESSGKPYFGYTKNDTGNWVKIESNQDCKNYYKISDLTTTSLIIVTKIGEENTINNGSYLLKARRYTTSCSSYKDSDPVSIQVNIPTPTPTPTPTPSSTPAPEPAATSVPESTNTPAPTSTPKPPTATPTPKPPTLTPTLKPTLKPTATATASGEILGSEQSSAAAFYPWEATGEAEAAPPASSSSPSRLLPAILLGAGFILLFSAAFWLWYTQLRK